MSGTIGILLGPIDGQIIVGKNKVVGSVSLRTKEFMSANILSGLSIVLYSDKDHVGFDLYSCICGWKV